MNFYEFPIQYLNQAIDDYALLVETLIKNKCTNCKYAKTCNPKRNVAGIEKREDRIVPQQTIPISVTYGIRFVCHKFSLRKTPVAWNETRIYKIAKSIKEDEK